MTFRVNQVPAQADYLSVLSRVPAERLKSFVEALLPHLGHVDALRNRTGLAMIPYTESVENSVFHLGEALIAEAQVRVGDVEGYGACLGRDLEQALAIAILDAALQGERWVASIVEFLRAEQATQTAEDDLLLRQVEATRVEMETF
ncbi:MAG: phosphonate C-P lyase system protein PhnG [Caldilineaceae bacterium]|nr:phosphonate C-P lyase system protein PhnG [Caldilineaceae bacterium]